MVERRKTVTVLFCDVVGSTALGESTDPEVVRAVLSRYFDRMKSIAEAHGGTVEKFIGDAVMAVFGVPVAHEDDALRACRAAVEMREALPGLGVEGRIGLMSGEVVTGTEERLATGDAVNVAARLQQAAQPGEVLIGEPVLVLAGAAIEVEEVESLELKGKGEPVRASRLLGAHAPEGRPRAEHFVGRERELAAIKAAWQRVRFGRCCELLTIVGEAGVGKSHLVAEALARIDGRVVQGRCPPYGEGITYWPVVEVIKQLDTLPAEPEAQAAIRSLLGESDARTSAEEIAWAFRKLLEQAAPLLVVFDDIQWGEETFLDLVEHVALLSTDSSILLLCMARPELVEQRSEWPVAVRLEPLAADDVDRLIGGRLPAELRDRIARASGGNPLFVSEMLAIAERADGEPAVPPTLRALLGDRLDRLRSDERAVLERGAVEGEVFHRGAVLALSPAGSQLTPRLAALVRKQLIRPDRAQLPGEDGFRFRHLLVRDAAYDSIPKAIRAELHERFADWLEQRAPVLVERDELIGHHVEQANRYRSELGEDSPELAQRAAEHLRAAAQRALIRRDAPASIGLLTRALSLLPPGVHLDIRLDLAIALHYTGDLKGAAEAACDAAREAHLVGDEPSEAAALLRECTLRGKFDPDVEAGRAALLERLTHVIEASDNERAKLELLYATQAEEHSACRYDAADRAQDAANEFARRTGRPHLDEGLGLDVFFGSATASLIRARLFGPGDTEHDVTRLHPFVVARLAILEGNLERARVLLDLMVQRWVEQGNRVVAAIAGAETGSLIELLSDDPAAAERRVRAGIDTVASLGETAWRCTALCVRADALVLLGDLDEAERCIDESRMIGAPNDVANELMWRRALAHVKSLRGEHEEAETLARQALTIVLEIESTLDQAETYACLSEVLGRAGKTDEAREHRDRAFELCERKEAPAYAAYFKRRLDAVVGASA